MADPRPGSPLEIVEVDAPAALEPHRAAWQALLERAETNTIYQTCEWITAWWRFFGRGRRLLVLLAFENGGLCGVAPLQISVKRINGRRERVLGFVGAENFASDYCDFIVPRGRRDVLEALLGRLRLQSRLWTACEFFNFPTHSAHYGVTREYWRATGLEIAELPPLEAPTAVLGDPAQDSKLAGKKSLKRHFNHFKSSGALAFRHCENAAEAQSRLPEFFEQHIRRWEKTGTPSLFRHPEQREFYRHLAEILAPRGWLRFGVVTHNDAAIAYHFGFEYGGRFIWYKPSFEVSLAKFSPGEVLLKFLLEYAVGRKLKEFDFTVGGEEFKHRFANLVRTNGRLMVFGRRSSWWLMRARLALRGTLTFLSS